MSKALRKELNKLDFEKIYLDDQPEFNAIVREFIQEIEPNFQEGYLSNETAPIDCRRCDGFIPNSHNHGGFEKQYHTNLFSVWGTGHEIGEYNQEAADKEYTEASETFIKYDATEDQKKIFESIPSEKHNYHDLCELGHGELAESMDEYCHEWLHEDSIWFGYRAMYEGQQGSWHTIIVYACANRDQYRGAFGGDSLAEIEIKFRNAKELKEKLEKSRVDLESAL